MGSEWDNLQAIFVLFLATPLYWQLGAALAGGIVAATIRLVAFWNRAIPVRIVGED